MGRHFHFLHGLMDDLAVVDEDDGAAFLLPYWLGRYQKLLFGE